MLDQFLARTHIHLRSLYDDAFDRLTSDVAARVRRVHASGDRGELLQNVVLIATFTAAAIVVGGIIVAKATGAAQGIQTK